jgi:hypothetical protein
VTSRVKPSQLPRRTLQVGIQSSGVSTMSSPAVIQRSRSVHTRPPTAAVATGTLRAEKVSNFDVVKNKVEQLRTQNQMQQRKCDVLV